MDRIVVINDLAEPRGGASLLAINSAHAFASKGHSVTILSGDKGPEHETPGIDHVFLGQDRLLSGNKAKALVRGLYNRPARKLISDWVAQNDTSGTIYHIHGWSQILSPSLFAALESVRGRVVTTAHDFFMTCPNGAIYDYKAAQPCQRLPMSSSCITANCDRRSYAQKLWRVGRQAIQDRLMERGEMPPLLLIHAGMRPYFERSGIPDDAMVTLPNPITPFCETPVRVEATRNVLFVGRMETTKGVDLAAEACRRANAKLIAVGDGELLEPLRRKYPEMLFVGRVPFSELGKYASQSRMLVMPSRHMEPYGLTAVEALWSGLPVLSSHHALIAADIDETGAGRQIDPRDIDGFAAAIAQIANDDTLAKRMSNAALENTRQLALEPDRWIDALIAIYRAMLRGGTSALMQEARSWRAPLWQDPMTACSKEVQPTCALS